MIKIQAQPDFWTEVEFIAPGGDKVGEARIKWRAIPRSEFNRMLAEPTDEVIAAVILDWEGIDDKFSAENVRRLLDLIPSSGRLLLDAFTRGLFGAERKNS